MKQTADRDWFWWEFLQRHFALFNPIRKLFPSPSSSFSQLHGKSGNKKAPSILFNLHTSKRSGSGSLRIDVFGNIKRSNTFKAVKVLQNKNLFPFFIFHHFLVAHPHLDSFSECDDAAHRLTPICELCKYAGEGESGGKVGKWKKEIRYIFLWKTGWAWLIWNMCINLNGVFGRKGVSGTKTFLGELLQEKMILGKSSN